jgi:hypothetical protein
MIPSVSAGTVTADLLRSLDTLSAALQDSQAQAAQLANKLLKVSVEQQVQDSTAGTIVNTVA